MRKQKISVAIYIINQKRKRVLIASFSFSHKPRILPRNTIFETEYNLDEFELQLRLLLEDILTALHKEEKNIVLISNMNLNRILKLKFRYEFIYATEFNNKLLKEAKDYYLLNK